MGDTDLSRYSRQILFSPLGEEGQRRLLAGRVVLVGCGALGTVLASTLVRAGVGFLRVIDRDFIEENNLQRQVLFDEDDIAANLPKAIAAAHKLRRINSQVIVEGVVADANHANIEQLAFAPPDEARARPENAPEPAHGRSGAGGRGGGRGPGGRQAPGPDLILDGTDNFETRFLINDLAVKHGIPWIYGACVAAEGLVMPILPGNTPCLRCIWEDAPPPGVSPTCDMAGVISPVVNLVASAQAALALRILTGRTDDLPREMLTIDAWNLRFRGMDMQAARHADCRCCGKRIFDYLEGRATSAATHLCGRNAVQILPGTGAGAGAAPPQPQRAGAAIDLAELAARVGKPARHNTYMLRFSVEGFDVTVFSDGRAIIKGTDDPAVARSIYSRYVGA